jgi:hypothetical protein
MISASTAATITASASRPSGPPGAFAAWANRSFSQLTMPSKTRWTRLGSPRW